MITIFTECYTVRDVMDKLHVGDETIYRWIRSGKLKAFRIGRDWRIDARSLEEAVSGGANNQGEESEI